jgi:transposase
VIAIEACGASHHCARLLQSFGHSVKLIAPQLVEPYIKRGKNDAVDDGSALRGDEPADDALRAGEDG